jgi:methanogenic corrinoid protein MtbC1
MLRDTGSLPSFIDGAVVGSLRETHYVAPEIAARNDLAERRARLAAIVGAEVVPRLAMLHRAVGAPDPVAVLPVSEDEIAALGRLLLGPDVAAPAAHVTMLRERGVDADALFLTLLEPAARFLGALWERDECDFVDVSLGLGRLQTLLAVFNCTHAVPALDRRRTVLLATMPKDPHVFGLSMVAKFLRSGGWTTTEDLGPSADRLASLVHEEWFAVVGLTVGSDRHLAALTAAIRSIRAASRNRAIGIMVGGSIFTKDPAIARTVGADATAVDAPTAVLLAQKLLDAGLRRDPHADAARDPSIGDRIRAV